MIVMWVIWEGWRARSLEEKHWKDQLLEYRSHHHQLPCKIEGLLIAQLQGALFSLYTTWTPQIQNTLWMVLCECSRRWSLLSPFYRWESKLQVHTASQGRNQNFLGGSLTPKLNSVLYTTLCHMLTVNGDTIAIASWELGKNAFWECVVVHMAKQCISVSFRITLVTSAVIIHSQFLPKPHLSICLCWTKRLKLLRNPVSNTHHRISYTFC